MRALLPHLIGWAAVCGTPGISARREAISPRAPCARVSGQGGTDVAGDGIDHRGFGRAAHERRGDRRVDVQPAVSYSARTDCQTDQRQVAAVDAQCELVAALLADLAQLSRFQAATANSAIDQGNRTLIRPTWESRRASMAAKVGSVLLIPHLLIAIFHQPRLLTARRTGIQTGRRSWRSLNRGPVTTTA